MTQINELKQRASILRARIIETSHKAGIPHLGSCLSCVDILTACIFQYYVLILRIHAHPIVIVLFLAKDMAHRPCFKCLAMRGFYPESLLENYGEDGGIFAEHPPAPSSICGY